ATSATSAGTWERLENVWLALTTVLPSGPRFGPSSTQPAARRSATDRPAFRSSSWVAVAAGKLTARATDPLPDRPTLTRRFTVAPQPLISTATASANAAKDNDVLCRRLKVPPRRSVSRCCRRRPARPAAVRIAPLP